MRLKRVNKPMLAIIIVAVCIYSIMIGLFVWTIAEYRRATPISSSVFPDPAFREYVRNRADLNGSGRLNDNEREFLEKIELSGKEVKSLEGIEQFPNLRVLECKNNNLKILDLSKNSLLERVDVSLNKLESIDLSGFEHLTDLYVDENALKSLDVSGCCALQRLSCVGNCLEILDISSQKLLELDCSRNLLSELDISCQKTLQVLKCDDNWIESLVLQSPCLKHLDCSYNRLSRLSNLGEELTFLDCSNNMLTSLDLSKCTRLSHMAVEFNFFESVDLSSCYDTVTDLEYAAIFGSFNPDTKMLEGLARNPQPRGKEKVRYICIIRKDQLMRDYSIKG